MPELLSICTLIICFVTILILLKMFGESGLYVYATVAVIASNIQVMKLTNYCLVHEPVALGTVVFSTTFAIDNILNEYFGAKSAKKCVWISFIAYLFFVGVMQIAVMHPSVISTECINMHIELQHLFSPTFTLFISSLIAYLMGQYTDICVFSTLKRILKGKYISQRAMISMAISTFVDNCVFSVFAWIIFAKYPISLSSLWTTYIFITYIIRLIIAMMCVPLVKLAKICIEKGSNVQKF